MARQRGYNQRRSQANARSPHRPDVLSLRYFPGLQSMHTLEPVAGDHWPSPQGSQRVLALPSATVPTPHVSQ